MVIPIGIANVRSSNIPGNFSCYSSLVLHATQYIALSILLSIDSLILSHKSFDVIASYSFEPNAAKIINFLIIY